MDTLIVHPTEDPRVTLEVKVLADSGNFLIHRQQAYERQVILSGWNPADRDMLLLARYKVHRLPEASFCEGLVWAGHELGFMSQGSMPVDDFWGFMPGFDRWQGNRANRAGLTLVKDLVVVMHDIALESVWIQELELHARHDSP